MTQDKKDPKDSSYDNDLADQVDSDLEGRTLLDALMLVVAASWPSRRPDQEDMLVHAIHELVTQRNLIAIRDDQLTRLRTKTRAIAKHINAYADVSAMVTKVDRSYLTDQLHSWADSLREEADRGLD